MLTLHTRIACAHIQSLVIKGVCLLSSGTAIHLLKLSKSVIALKVPIEQCNSYIINFKSLLYSSLGIRPVRADPSDNRYRLLLLNETIKGVHDLPVVLRALLNKDNIALQVHHFDASYKHMSIPEALSLLLPPSVGPIAFSLEGQLARLNLTSEALPYKHTIGQVILDKTPSIRAVVNKTDTIDNEFRTTPIELLAGDENLTMTKKESGAVLSFDFRNVYWNARLELEHARLISLISGLSELRPSASESGVLQTVARANTKRDLVRRLKQQQQQQQQQQHREVVTVVDMMAGVGPFSIPLAMGHLGPPTVGQIVVHANDLNPSSFQWLVRNAQINKCGDRLTAYNMDGRDFVNHLFTKGVVMDEVIMNLPHKAVEMLDVFVGMKHKLRGPQSDSQAQWVLPRIHVYAFAGRSVDPVLDVVQRVAAVLRCDPALLNYQNSAEKAAVGQVVRWVTAKKAMIRLSFYLPVEVAESEPIY